MAVYLKNFSENSVAYASNTVVEEILLGIQAIYEEGKFIKNTSTITRRDKIKMSYVHNKCTDRPAEYVTDNKIEYPLELHNST